MLSANFFCSVTSTFPIISPFFVSTTLKKFGTRLAKLVFKYAPNGTLESILYEFISAATSAYASTNTSSRVRPDCIFGSYIEFTSLFTIPSLFFTISFLAFVISISELSGFLIIFINSSFFSEVCIFSSETFSVIFKILSLAFLNSLKKPSLAKLYSS